jgi:3-isopropylmalate dehydrogenase
VLDEVSNQFGLGLAFHEELIGFAALKEKGSTFPDTVLPAVRTCDGVILGPVSHNEYPSRDAGGLNPSAELRKQLDLFANIRPAHTRGGIAPRAGVPLDLVVVRENTEGFYADRNMHQGPGEMMVTEDVAIAFRRITRHACMRIARAAFELAKSRSGRLTAVHKANVMRTTCGLFLACCRRCADEYPDIQYREQLVDAMCAHLVRSPDQHDVIVTTNMFGDILSDLAAELAGSLGLAASVNAGEDHVMAQAQHGSAPDIAGQDRANPASLIGSAAMMLDWLGQRKQQPALVEAAAAIERALDKVLSDATHRTPDLGGNATTTAMTDAIVGQLAARG